MSYKYKPAEDAIIRRLWLLNTPAKLIARELRAAGFERTPGAVSHRARDLKIRRTGMVKREPKSGFPKDVITPWPDGVRFEDHPNTVRDERTRKAWVEGEG